MYNVKGPSNIMTKTARRGITQNIESYRDLNRNKPNQLDLNNISKPVFHKKSSPTHQRQELITPEHEELINFIQDSWKSVYSEVGGNGKQNVVYYEDEGSNLQDFKPFDLEAWWGKRLFAYITNTKS